MPQVQRLADSIEQIVLGSVGLTARALTEASPDAELTFSQWRALLVVGEAEDGARVGEVAERVAVTPPATSRMLRRLSERGFITLATDESDRRATRARLTARGKEIRSAIVAYRRRALRTLAKGIVPSEREELTRAAATISAAFSRFE